MNSLVRDVMTTEVVAVEPWTPFREIVARLAAHRISAAPVVDMDGHVLGVVSEADLLLKQEYPDPRRTSRWPGAGAAWSGRKQPRRWPGRS